jgi:hypothetical protein
VSEEEAGDASSSSEGGERDTGVRSCAAAARRCARAVLWGSLESRKLMGVFFCDRRRQIFLSSIFFIYSGCAWGVSGWKVSVGFRQNSKFGAKTAHN